jgi:hypothetical protein
MGFGVVFFNCPKEEKEAKTKKKQDRVRSIWFGEDESKS